MNLDDLIQRAIEINNKYDELNVLQNIGPWNEQQLMAGFVGDVGDLSKIIMAKSGLRAIDDVDSKLAHELADCLWSVLVLSKKYQVNLENEFVAVMDSLEAKITQKQQTLTRG